MNQLKTLTKGWAVQHHGPLIAFMEGIDTDSSTLSLVSSMMVCTPSREQLQTWPERSLRMSTTRCNANSVSTVLHGQAKWERVDNQHINSLIHNHIYNYDQSYALC